MDESLNGWFGYKQGGPPVAVPFTFLHNDLSIPLAMIKQQDGKKKNHTKRLDPCIHR